MEASMKHLGLVIACVVPLSLLASGSVRAAKGIGKTVTEGAKYSGKKVQEAVK
jgi:predicted small secreted protein